MRTVREAEAIRNFPNSSFTFNQASRMLNFRSQHMLIRTNAQCVFE